MRIVLDACVLFPTVLRDILLNVAARGLFTPLWSPHILEEWARATRKLAPGAETVARGEIALLTARWPEAITHPRGSDLARLHLPDPDDVHVLAAAIAGSADGIVTFNARDFPRHTLAEEGLTRQDPDQFLRGLHGVDASAVTESIDVVHKTAERLSGETLALQPILKRAGLPRLAKLIVGG